MIVIVTMALAIAANTTILSLMQATVLRRIGTSEPHRLVAITTTDTRNSAPGQLYLSTVEAFRERQRSFSSLAMYAAGFFRSEARGASFDLAVDGVTPEYFELMRPRLVAGRYLTVPDDATTPPGVVISERLWLRVFGGDPNAVGETFTINSEPATIVGITGAEFDGLNTDGGTDAFLPLGVARALSGDRRGPARARFVIGRLAPGVSLDAARAEVMASWPAIEAETTAALPEAERTAVASQRLSVESASNGFSVMTREWGPSFMVVFGLTSILLAIGAVNLMGMMSARVLAKRQELAVCMALGAGRARILRRLLVEGVMLAACALALALPLAWWMSAVLQSMLTIARATPLLRPMTPDTRVVVVAVVVALGMGVAMALLPALGAARSPAADSLRQGRGTARAFSRSSRAVLIVQVALSMVLLVGAGLFAGMLAHLYANDAAFRDREVLWTRLARVPGYQRTLLGPEYFRNLVDRLSAIPGADAVALNLYFPAYLGFRGGFPLDRYTIGETAATEGTSGITELVTPGFFDLFGMTRLRGRDFTWTDDAAAPRVAIANESLARSVFQSTDVVGRRLRVQSGSAAIEVEIVGVVADAPMGSIREPRQVALFRPMLQEVARAQFPMAHVRTRGRASALAAAYTRAVESQGQHYIRGLFTLEQWLDNALLQERLIAGVSTFAALMALLLACLGVYGALAYAVVSRLREIGVRMALGASRDSVVKMILRDGLAVVVPGILIGIPLALGAAMLVRSQLYGVAPTDPPTIIGAAVLFVVTGLVAAWLPARRASRTDPCEALRQE